MDETLIASCHRALLKARMIHPSVDGYELLLHPALRSTVAEYEESMRVRPGSFATLVGALRIVYTLGAGASFSVFCRTHMHRLDEVTGAAQWGETDEDGTIAP